MSKRQKVSSSGPPVTALPATVTAGRAVPRSTPAGHATQPPPPPQKKQPTLIKQLANPENQEQRERAFHLLRRWLTSTGHAVTQLDQHKIWRGLYYMFWHSDGYKTQQAEAAELASLVTMFGRDAAGQQRCVDYLYAYCKCMQREWQLIDGLRMDKFMTLVRRMMHATLQRMQQSHWEVSVIDALLQPYREVILCVEALHASRGLQIHIIELYLQTLEAVLTSDVTKQTAATTVSPAAMSALLEPFIHSLTIASPDDSVALRTVKYVLTPLAESSSDDNVQYPAVAALLHSNRSSLISRLDEAVSVAGISTVRRDAMLQVRDQLAMADEAESEQTTTEAPSAAATESESAPSAFSDVEEAKDDAASDVEPAPAPVKQMNVKATSKSNNAATEAIKAAKQTPSKPIDIVQQKKRRQRLPKAA